MKVAVISSSPLVRKKEAYHAYSPYVKELKLWAKYADEMAFCCPIWEEDKGLLIAPIDFPFALYPIREFNIKTPWNFLKACWFSWMNFWQLFRIMFWADHIHLRCPGNVGLMGCWVQIFFPHKLKTAKYAGNWDPKSIQPRTYKWQQSILSNTFLTRNIRVLVYGHWPGSSHNIHPFFTATYREAEKIPVAPRDFSSGIEMIYVGTLSPGKKPLYAIQLVEQLRASHPQIKLSLYGHGAEKANLEAYIKQNNLSDFVTLKGNFAQEAMKAVYQSAHGLILPSDSEGWPKVVAEAMFWACVPVATRVSCVPDMLGEGSRGVLLEMDLQTDAQQISRLVADLTQYQQMAQQAMEWSRHYTLDQFELAIQKFLRP